MLSCVKTPRRWPSELALCSGQGSRGPCLRLQRQNSGSRSCFVFFVFFFWLYLRIRWIGGFGRHGPSRFLGGVWLGGRRLGHHLCVSAESQGRRPQKRLTWLRSCPSLGRRLCVTWKRSRLHLSVVSKVCFWDSICVKKITHFDGCHYDYERRRR